MEELVLQDELAWALASCGVIPRRDSLEQAVENLIGLSNSFAAAGTTSDQIDRRVRAIEEALKLPRLM